MISTFLAYRLYANDPAKSLQRIAAEPQNANSQQYFDANIGKVTSVDDFVNNYKLLSYAMKAYGLQDLGNAKGLMKKVLESDLSDKDSFVNKLNDSRYRAFAQAFAFTTKGAVATSGVAQTNAQRQDTLTRLGLSDAGAASAETDLAAIHSVGDFEENDSLYSRVLAAYGVDPNGTPRSDVTAALESDLSDPASFANRAANSGFRTLAEDFNFAKDGAAGPQTAIQSVRSIQATVTAYLGKAGASASAQKDAHTETAYYLAKLPTLTSVDQLVADPRLVAYVKTATGLAATTTPTQLRAILTSDLQDRGSVANKAAQGASAPSAAQLAAAAFSVGPDGAAFDHGAAQSNASLAATTAAYTAAIAAKAAQQGTADAKATTAAGAAETAYYQTHIGNVTSVGGLLGDTRLVAYLRTAFGLPAPPATTTTPQPSGTYSQSDLRNILTSDVLSPSSAANTSGDGARKLATSFNFAASGLVYDHPAVQTDASVTATTKAYMSQAGASAGAQAAAKAETSYYTATIPHVKNIGDLLGDKRLVAYIEKAYGVPASTPPATLKQVLTSTITDPKSVASKLGGAFLTLAAAFDIGSTGAVQSEPTTQVQTKAAFAATVQGYLAQSMEAEAGTTYGDGARLALYFKRVAPTITSAYGLLADKALNKVTQTILGLSSLSAKADVDSQARYISSKIDIADFKDPAKLDKLVDRFAALYDIQNSQTTSTVASLF